MVVRNYTPTDLKVAGDITSAGSNYTMKVVASGYAQVTNVEIVSREN